MEIKPQADRIMHALLQILNTLNNKSSVADSVFAAVGGLANALGEDFENYMSAFSPYLYRALGNKEEPGLCAMAIGLVSDITRALEEKALPYCNDFMNYLLENLRVSRSCSHLERRRANLLRRVPPSATSSSLLSCNASETSHKLLEATSSNTSPLWLKF